MQKVWGRAFFKIRKINYGSTYITRSKEKEEKEGQKEMRVYFWRSNNERILRCRRGKNHYRPLTIPANVDVCEYTPLTNSIIELVDQGMVIGEAEIDSAVELTIMLKSTDNLERVANESTSKEPVDEQISDESPSEDENTMQPMVHESTNNAAALSGAVDVQVSSVVGRDDGHGSLSERGSESSPDGVYGSYDGMDVPQDRSGEEVDSVSSPDEDPSSD